MAAAAPTERAFQISTQAEVAFDRFLLAYLSRLQAGHLLGNLMQDFRGPAIAPRLEHSATLPVGRIGQEKWGASRSPASSCTMTRRFRPYRLSRTTLVHAQYGFVSPLRQRT